MSSNASSRATLPHISAFGIILKSLFIRRRNNRIQWVLRCWNGRRNACSTTRAHPYVWVILIYVIIRWRDGIRHGYSWWDAIVRTRFWLWITCPYANSDWKQQMSILMCQSLKWTRVRVLVSFRPNSFARLWWLILKAKLLYIITWLVRQLLDSLILCRG